MKKIIIPIALFVLVFLGFSLRLNTVNPSSFRDAPKDSFNDIIEEAKNSSDNIPVPVKAVLDNSVERPKFSPVAIYGENNIRDYYMVKRPLRELSHSVCAFVSKDSLIFDEKKGKYIGVTDLIKDTRYLADDEDFSDQLSLSFCSGSLVGKDLVLTAGHCVDNESLENTYIVFGWRQEGKGNYKLEFSEDEVYKIESIVARKLKSEELNGINALNRYEDYAIVKLNRPVENLKPLTLERTGSFVIPENYVFTIGYPMGMSVKITDPDGAKIYEVGENIFSTDLDTFGGNSGGPVFDSYTKRIEGILVAGDAQEVKYTLKENVSANYLIHKSTEIIIERDSEGKTKIKLPLKLFKAIKRLAEKRKESAISINEENKTITFSRGGVYYDSQYLFMAIISHIAHKKIRDLFEKGKLYRVESYSQGSGTLVQRINSIIDFYIPFNDEEKAFCRAISNKIQRSRPVIDPKLIMLYKQSGCDKKIEI